MESNILYTIGCPMCKMLEERLDKAGIQYETHTDAEEMTNLGFTSAPMFYCAAEQKNMSVLETITWLKERSESSGH